MARAALRKTPFHMLVSTVVLDKWSDLNLGYKQVLLQNEGLLSIFKLLVHLSKNTGLYTQVPPTS